jgi:hypothetical protein
VLGRLAVPAGGAPGCPATYAFRYGNVGFISLDSNDVSYEIPANFGYSAGSQLRWLEAILARYRRDRSGVDFIVVYFHHCAFSTSNAHGSEGGVRELWVPLFDRYAVDLVINGHNHSYERTLPLRAGRPVAGGAGEVDSTAGTTYVTAGGGGAVRTPGFGHVSGKSTIWQSDGRPYSEAVDWSMPTGADQYSVLIAEVAPGPAAGGETTMKLRAVGADGTVLDRVTLRRPARPHDPAAAQAEGGGDGVAPWAIGGAAALATVAAAGGGYAVHRHLATR